MVTNAPAELPTVRLDDLRLRAVAAFRSVLERYFRDDPFVNPLLPVEVVEAVPVGGVDTMVLIAPWWIGGLIVLPGPVVLPGPGPAELRVAGRVRPVFRGDVAPLGTYWAVRLVPDVSRLHGPRQARAVAGSVAGPFRDGVRNWLSTTMERGVE